MVASIDTRTGDTALISLSRNFDADAVPGGLAAAQGVPGRLLGPGRPGDVEQPELLPGRDVPQPPAAARRLLGESDNEGADVLKVSVGEALGPEVALLHAGQPQGFGQIIDALGGIKVNVNYKVPIGGDYKGPGPGRRRCRTTTSSRARTSRWAGHERSGSPAAGTG